LKQQQLKMKTCSQLFHKSLWNSMWFSQ